MHIKEEIIVRITLMNDYLEPYEDMSAYSFAVAEEFLEPITNALCKTMGFVFDRKENLKVFPNSSFKGNEVFCFYKSKNDERAFMIAVQGNSVYWGISIKCKAEDKLLFYNTIKKYLEDNNDYTGIPFLQIDEFEDQLRKNYSKIQQNLFENDLRDAGLI